MTLKNRLLLEINSDLRAFIDKLKAKNFVHSQPCETNKNILFRKSQKNYVCGLDFLCAPDNELVCGKYTDIIFYLHEKTDKGFKTWTSMFGSHGDNQAIIIKQFLE